MLDADGKLTRFTQSGLGAHAGRLAQQLEQPQTVYCAQKAWAQSGVQIIADTQNQCGDCCLATVQNAKDALTIKLEHESKVYGILTVSLPPGVTPDEEEYRLFGEVAGDIAFALHTIEMEEQRLRAEIELESSLQEKIQLIRELYHRTKNNMQVIISMLMIQAGFVDNEQVKDLLQDMVSRIQAMALVHEKLYRSQTLSSINLDEYIRDLAQLLVKTYHVAPHRVTLTFDLEPIPTLIDTAMPSGLVLNELISNALKHAFPGDRVGEIKVILQRASNQDIVLTISDNGIGMPQNFDVKKSETFGLQTLVAIVEFATGHFLGNTEIHGDFAEIHRATTRKTTFMLNQYCFQVSQCSSVPPLRPLCNRFGSLLKKCPVVKL